jgi:type I restriction enzyme M protein
MQEPSKSNSGDKIYVTENYVTWTSYNYITETIYFRKTDKIQVTKDEYDAADKKSDYTVKIQTRTVKEEHKSSDGKDYFIKDLFLEEHGELDTHRKWVLKNISFKLKNKKKDSGIYNDAITITEYLTLPEEDQKHYKEAAILGENPNSPISIDEYNALDKAVQKFYLVAEDVSERTERVKDTHGHIFVKHDLFNHDPAMPNPNPKNIYSQDGIAEAFIEFAKREGLSFFQ